MEDFTIAIYCFLDDLLNNTHKLKGTRRKLSDAQIITTALVAARYFSGNYVKARHYLKEVHKFNFPDKSNFNRLLNRLSLTISTLFFSLGQLIKKLNINSDYLIDSFPIAVCKNIRIKNCKLLDNERYRGYNASKKEYFYGFKIQVITTDCGIPVEYCIGAGSFHDCKVFKAMNIDLPKGSSLFADAAYNDYKQEDMYAEIEDITLLVARKKNAKRKDIPAMSYIKSVMRKQIETTFSEICAYMPKKIHAVTPEGFILKIVLFIFAYTCERVLYIAT